MRPRSGGDGHDEGLRQARALCARGRLSAAERKLSAVVRRGAADGPRACQELVQLALRRHGAAGAEDALRELLPADGPLRWHGLGYFFRRTGRDAEARPWLARAARARPAVQAARAELGWIECTSGNLDRGLRRLRAAEAACRRRGDDWGQAVALSFQATLALQRWELGRARRQLRTAMALRARCDDVLGLAAASHNLAVLESECARHGEALPLYENALATWRRWDQRGGAIASLNGLGKCHLELGNPDRAAEALREATRLSRRSRNPADRAHEPALRLNLALALRQLLGERAPVRRELHAALDALRRRPDARLEGLVAGALAEFHSRRGDGQRALAVLRAHGASPTDLKARLRVDVERARALLVSGRPAAAVSEARRAVALAEGSGAGEEALPLQLADARVVLARALAAAGRAEEARRLLRGTARGVERLLDRLPSAALRMGLLSFLRVIGDARLPAVLDGGPSSARRAWAVARDLKARHLQAPPKRPGRRLSAARHRIGEVEAEIRHLAGTGAGTPGTRRRLRELRARYLALVDAAIAGTTRGTRERAGARETSRLVGNDAAVLEYHVAEATTWLFLVHRGKVSVVDLGLPEARLASAVRRLTAPLREAGHGPAPVAHLAAHDVDLARRLHRALLAPALARLPESTRRLVLVPDGVLHELPFGLLATGPPTAPGGDAVAAVASVPVVADTHEVVTAVSSRPDAGGPPPRSAPRSVLALAFSPRSSVTLSRVERDLELAPLPAAAAEARSVAARYPEARLVTGRRATVESLAGGASRADVVHLAAHGFADARAPGLSGLVVSDGTGGVDVLTAERLHELPTGARVVVLSACDTGRGRLVGREGIVGLARAFLEAGARTVLATRWPVDDGAARRFVTHFHRELRGGAPPVTALASARLAFRRSGAPERAHAHPFFWAGFSLVGRGVDSGT